jgi:hypothetical protein
MFVGIDVAIGLQKFIFQGLQGGKIFLPRINPWLIALLKFLANAL